MQQKSFILKNLGMQRDRSISKPGESAAYENRNIRITQSDNDTTLSVANERGNRKLDSLSLEGTLVGYGVLNSYVILFTADDDISRIYRVEYSADEFKSVLVFSGNLDFDTSHPIETIMDYESDDIQKVYWIDGKNVLRFLNFSDAYLNSHLKGGSLYWNPVFSFSEDTTWFDSTRQSNAIPSVVISKDSGGNTRANGVAQYFITCYNKNGQQTGILYSSPLVYLSPEGHGGAADGTNTSRVTFSMSGLDSTFDYVRLYRIVRTSLDASVSAAIVGESSISDGIVTIVDDGAHDETVDPSSFLYLGSQDVVAGTMAQKDGTLFLGNLKSVGNSGIDSIEDEVKSSAFVLSSERFEYGKDWESAIVEFRRSSSRDITAADCHIPYIYADGYYPYESQLKYTNSQISTFKGGEKYRFALRFIRSNGTMSKPFWIGDKVNPYYPRMRSDSTVARAVAVCTIPDSIVHAATNAGFCSVQLMIAMATYADRSVQAQGIVSPTVFNLYSRYLGQCFSQSSWMFRPKGGGCSFRHLSVLQPSDSTYSEMQCSWWGKDSRTPIPLYYKTNAGKLYNEPYGYKEYESVAVDVEVHAQKIVTKYWGTINIRYYASKDDQEPAKTYSINIGGGSATYNNSKTKLVRDWLQAYDTADVPVNNRTTEDNMRDVCHTALHKASWTKPGRAEYSLQKTSVDFYSRDYSRLYSRSNRQFYFIDENTVTLNSPEISYGAVSLDRNGGLKFRIVGAARMTGSMSDYTIRTDNAEFPGERRLLYNFSQPNISDDIEGLTAYPFYMEYGYSGVKGDYKRADQGYSYMMYMWHRSGSIPAFGDDDGLWSMLSRKRIANLHFSMYSVYNDYGENAWTVNPYDVRQIGQDGASTYELKRRSSAAIYSSDVNDLVVMPEDVTYPIFASKTESSGRSLSEMLFMQDVNDPIPVTYKSMPHAVIGLPVNGTEDTILPYLFDSDSFRLDTIPTSENVSGPFAPWQDTSYGKRLLLYRMVNTDDADAVSNLSSGAYGGFETLRMDTDNMVITAGIGLYGDSMENMRYNLETMLGVINESARNKTVYAHIGDASSKVRLVDVSGMRIVKTAVDVYTNMGIMFTVGFSSTDTMKSIDFSLYDADGKLVKQCSANADSMLYSFNLPMSSVSGRKFPLSIRCTVSYSATYTNSSSVVVPLIPDFSAGEDDAIQIPSISYSSIKESRIHYAYVADAVYIDPAENTSEIELVDIAFTPNTIIRLDTSHRMSVGGLYTSELKEPKQSMYKLPENYLISEGDKYLFIGELYRDYDSISRDDPSLDTRYGGITEGAVEGNTFVAAGQRVPLDALTTVKSYATAEIDCSGLYEKMCSDESFTGMSFTLQTDFVDKASETIELDELSSLTSSDFLPSSDNRIDTLRIEKNAEGNWVSVIDGITDLHKKLITESGDYKIAILREGYARRGKYRTYINKYGDRQTSHTIRNSYYKTMRVGDSRSLPPKRMRIIGMDLLLSRKTIAQQTESSTWKTVHKDGSLRVDYTKATLVSPLGGALVLPPLGRNLITDKRRYSNKSKNGITDLYIGLCHRENGRWEIVSNAVPVRGRSDFYTKIWEFEQSNVVRDMKNEQV